MTMQWESWVFLWSPWSQALFLGNAASMVSCFARGTHFEATTCFTSSKRTLLGSYLSFIASRFHFDVQLRRIVCSLDQSGALKLLWGSKSSVWLLGRVDICNGVALLGSVAPAQFAHVPGQFVNSTLSKHLETAMAALFKNLKDNITWHVYHLLSQHTASFRDPHRICSA